MQTLIDGAKFIALWGTIIGVVVIVIAGVRDRVVIYFDKKDFWISFLPWVLYFVCVYLVTDGDAQTPIDFTAPPEGMVIPLYIMYTAIVICLVAIIKRSIYYNRSFFLGVCIALFKVLFSLFAVFGLLGYMSRAMDSNKGFGQRISALVVFAVLYTLWEEFINGHNVYRQKGWALPDKNKPERFNLDVEPAHQQNNSA